MKYLLALGTPYMKLYLLLFLCFKEVTVSIQNTYSTVVIEHANQSNKTWLWHLSEKLIDTMQNQGCCNKNK